MKILFCAYDRPNHITSGPNAWLQRLVPDLISNYGLDIQTLFIYSGDIRNSTTIAYFKENNLPIHLINRDSCNYVEESSKRAVKHCKKRTYINCGCQFGCSRVICNSILKALQYSCYRCTTF